MSTEKNPEFSGDNKPNKGDLFLAQLNLANFKVYEVSRLADRIHKLDERVKIRYKWIGFSRLLIHKFNINCTKKFAHLSISFNEYNLFYIRHYFYFWKKRHNWVKFSKSILFNYYHEQIQNAVPLIVEIKKKKAIKHWSKLTQKLIENDKQELIKDVYNKSELLSTLQYFFNIWYDRYYNRLQIKQARLNKWYSLTDKFLAKIIRDRLTKEADHIQRRKNWKSMSKAYLQQRTIENIHKLHSRYLISSYIYQLAKRYRKKQQREKLEKAALRLRLENEWIYLSQTLLSNYKRRRLDKSKLASDAAAKVRKATYQLLHDNQVSRLKEEKKRRQEKVEARQRIEIFKRYMVYWFNRSYIRRFMRKSYNSSFKEYHFSVCDKSARVIQEWFRSILQKQRSRQRLLFRIFMEWRKLPLRITFNSVEFPEVNIPIHTHINFNLDMYAPKLNGDLSVLTPIYERNMAYKSALVKEIAHCASNSIQLDIIPKPQFSLLPFSGARYISHAMKTIDQKKQWEINHLNIPIKVNITRPLEFVSSSVRNDASKLINREPPESSEIDEDYLNSMTLRATKRKLRGVGINLYSLKTSINTNLLAQFNSEDTPDVLDQYDLTQDEFTPDFALLAGVSDQQIDTINHIIQSDIPLNLDFVQEAMKEIDVSPIYRISNDFISVDPLPEITQIIEPENTIDEEIYELAVRDFELDKTTDEVVSLYNEPFDYLKRCEPEKLLVYDRTIEKEAAESIDYDDVFRNIAVLYNDPIRALPSYTQIETILERKLEIDEKRIEKPLEEVYKEITIDLDGLDIFTPSFYEDAHPEDELFINIPLMEIESPNLINTLIKFRNRRFESRDISIVSKYYISKISFDNTLLLNSNEIHSILGYSGPCDSQSIIMKPMNKPQFTQQLVNKLLRLKSTDPILPKIILSIKQLLPSDIPTSTRPKLIDLYDFEVQSFDDIKIENHLDSISYIGDTLQSVDLDFNDELEEDFVDQMYQITIQSTDPIDNINQNEIPELDYVSGITFDIDHKEIGCITPLETISKREIPVNKDEPSPEERSVIISQEMTDHEKIAVQLDIPKTIQKGGKLNIISQFELNEPIEDPLEDIVLDDIELLQFTDVPIKVPVDYFERIVIDGIKESPIDISVNFAQLNINPSFSPLFNVTWDLVECEQMLKLICPKLDVSLPQIPAKKLSLDNYIYTEPKLKINLPNDLFDDVLFDTIKSIGQSKANCVNRSLIVPEEDSFELYEEISNEVFKEIESLFATDINKYQQNQKMAIYNMESSLLHVPNTIDEMAEEVIDEFLNYMNNPEFEFGDEFFEQIGQEIETSFSPMKFIEMTLNSILDNAILQAPIKEEEIPFEENDFMFDITEIINNIHTAKANAISLMMITNEKFLPKVDTPQEIDYELPNEIVSLFDSMLLSTISHTQLLNPEIILIPEIEPAKPQIKGEKEENYIMEREIFQAPEENAINYTISKGLTDKIEETLGSNIVNITDLQISQIALITKTGNLVDEGSSTYVEPQVSAQTESLPNRQEIDEQKDIATHDIETIVNRISTHFDDIITDTLNVAMSTTPICYEITRIGPSEQSSPFTSIPEESEQHDESKKPSEFKYTALKPNLSALITETAQNVVANAFSFTSEMFEINRIGPSESEIETSTEITSLPPQEETKEQDQIDNSITYSLPKSLTENCTTTFDGCINSISMIQTNQIQLGLSFIDQSQPTVEDKATSEEISQPAESTKPIESKYTSITQDLSELITATSQNAIANAFLFTSEMFEINRIGPPESEIETSTEITSLPPQEETKEQDQIDNAITYSLPKSLIENCTTTVDGCINSISMIQTNQMQLGLSFIDQSQPTVEDKTTSEEISQPAESTKPIESKYTSITQDLSELITATSQNVLANAFSFTSEMFEINRIGAPESQTEEQQETQPESTPIDNSIQYRLHKNAIEHLTLTIHSNIQDISAIQHNQMQFGLPIIDPTVQPEEQISDIQEQKEIEQKDEPTHFEYKSLQTDLTELLNETSQTVINNAMALSPSIFLINQNGPQAEQNEESNATEQVSTMDNIEAQYSLPKSLIENCTATVDGCINSISMIQTNQMQLGLSFIDQSQPTVEDKTTSEEISQPAESTKLIESKYTSITQDLSELITATSQNAIANAFSFTSEMFEINRIGPSTSSAEAEATSTPTPTPTEQMAQYSLPKHVIEYCSSTLDCCINDISLSHINNLQFALSILDRNLQQSDRQSEVQPASEKQEPEELSEQSNEYKSLQTDLSVLIDETSTTSISNAILFLPSLFEIKRIGPTQSENIEYETKAEPEVTQSPAEKVTDYKLPSSVIDNCNMILNSSIQSISLVQSNQMALGLSIIDDTQASEHTEIENSQEITEANSQESNQDLTSIRNELSNYIDEATSTVLHQAISSSYQIYEINRIGPQESQIETSTEITSLPPQDETKEQDQIDNAITYSLPKSLIENCTTTVDGCINSISMIQTNQIQLGLSFIDQSQPIVKDKATSEEISQPAESTKPIESKYTSITQDLSELITATSKNAIANAFSFTSEMFEINRIGAPEMPTTDKEVESISPPTEHAEKYSLSQSFIDQCNLLVDSNICDISLIQIRSMQFSLPIISEAPSEVQDAAVNKQEIEQHLPSAQQSNQILHSDISNCLDETVHNALNVANSVDLSLFEINKLASPETNIHEIKESTAHPIEEIENPEDVIHYSLPSSVLELCQFALDSSIHDISMTQPNQIIIGLPIIDQTISENQPELSAPVIIQEQEEKKQESQYTSLQSDLSSYLDETSKSVINNAISFAPALYEINRIGPQETQLEESVTPEPVSTKPEENEIQYKLPTSFIDNCKMTVDSSIDSISFNQINEIQFGLLIIDQETSSRQIDNPTQEPTIQQDETEPIKSEETKYDSLQADFLSYFNAISLSAISNAVSFTPILFEINRLGSVDTTQEVSPKLETDSNEISLPNESESTYKLPNAVLEMCCSQMQSSIIDVSLNQFEMMQFGLLVLDQEIPSSNVQQETEIAAQPRETEQIQSEEYLSLRKDLLNYINDASKTAISTAISFAPTLFEITRIGSKEDQQVSEKAESVSIKPEENDIQYKLPTSFIDNCIMTVDSFIDSISYNQINEIQFGLLIVDQETSSRLIDNPTQEAIPPKEEITNESEQDYHQLDESLSNYFNDFIETTIINSLSNSPIMFEINSLADDSQQEAPTITEDTAPPIKLIEYSLPNTVIDNLSSTINASLFSIAHCQLDQISILSNIIEQTISTPIENEVQPIEQVTKTSDNVNEFDSSNITKSISKQFDDTIISSLCCSLGSAPLLYEINRISQSEVDQSTRIEQPETVALTYTLPSSIINHCEMEINGAILSIANSQADQILLGLLIGEQSTEQQPKEVETSTEIKKETPIQEEYKSIEKDLSNHLDEVISNSLQNGLLALTPDLIPFEETKSTETIEKVVSKETEYSLPQLIVDNNEMALTSSISCIASSHIEQIAIGMHQPSMQTESKEVEINEKAQVEPEKKDENAIYTNLNKVFSQHFNGTIQSSLANSLNNSPQLYLIPSATRDEEEAHQEKQETTKIVEYSLPSIVSEHFTQLLTGDISDIYQYNINQVFIGLGLIPEENESPQEESMELIEEIVIEEEFQEEVQLSANLYDQISHSFDQMIQHSLNISFDLSPTLFMMPNQVEQSQTQETARETPKEKIQETAKYVMPTQFSSFIDNSIQSELNSAYQNPIEFGLGNVEPPIHTEIVNNNANIDMNNITNHIAREFSEVISGTLQASVSNEIDLFCLPYGNSIESNQNDERVNDNIQEIDYQLPQSIIKDNEMTFSGSIQSISATQISQIYFGLQIMENITPNENRSTNIEPTSIEPTNEEPYHQLDQAFSNTLDNMIVSTLNDSFDTYSPELFLMPLQITKPSEKETVVPLEKDALIEQQTKETIQYSLPSSLTNNLEVQLLGSLNSITNSTNLDLISLPIESEEQQTPVETEQQVQQTPVETEQQIQQPKETIVEYKSLNKPISDHLDKIILTSLCNCFDNSISFGISIPSIESTPKSISVEKQEEIHYQLPQSALDNLEFALLGSIHDISRSHFDQLPLMNNQNYYVPPTESVPKEIDEPNKPSSEIKNYTKLNKEFGKMFDDMIFQSLNTPTFHDQVLFALPIIEQKVNQKDEKTIPKEIVPYQLPIKVIENADEFLNSSIISINSQHFTNLRLGIPNQEIATPMNETVGNQSNKEKQLSVTFTLHDDEQLQQPPDQNADTSFASSDLFTSLKPIKKSPSKPLLSPVADNDSPRIPSFLSSLFDNLITQTVCNSFINHSDYIPCSSSKNEGKQVVSNEVKTNVPTEVKPNVPHEVKHDVPNEVKHDAPNEEEYASVYDSKPNNADLYEPSRFPNLLVSLTTNEAKKTQIHDDENWDATNLTESTKPGGAKYLRNQLSNRINEMAQSILINSSHFHPPEFYCLPPIEYQNPTENARGETLIQTQESNTNSYTLPKTATDLFSQILNNNIISICISHTETIALESTPS